MAAVVNGSGPPLILTRLVDLGIRRWHNQLNPSIKKDSWTPVEDQLIIELQAKHGNAWAKIADQLDGRTDNAVKNRWHSSLLKSSTFRASRSKRQATKKRGTSTKRPRRDPLRPPRVKEATPIAVVESVSSPTAVDAILQETGRQLRYAAPLSPPLLLAMSEPQSPTASIKMEIYGEQQPTFHDLLAEHTFDMEGMIEEGKSEVSQSFEALEVPLDWSSYSPLARMLLTNECLDDDSCNSSSSSSSLEPFPFSHSSPSMDDDRFLLNSVWKGEVEDSMDAMVETEAPSLVDHHEPSSSLGVQGDCLSSSVTAPFAISDTHTLFSSGYSFPMPCHTGDVVGVALMTADYGEILL